LAGRLRGDGRSTKLRHSRLTHLAEAGVDLPLLMAKSRHASIRSLGLARPTFEAVAAATARLDAASRRRSKNP
jgi:hypothetical protein